MMDKELEELLDRVIEAMLRIPPIVQRKLHREVVKVALEEVGVDFAPHHMGIMKVLQETGESHISEIGEMMGIAKSQMTHSVDKLIAAGMVERKAVPEDRRKINLRLTQKGAQKLEELDEMLKERMKGKLSTLSDHELKKLAEAFDCIAETFSRLQ
jgi:DNA-binding MarR family transcriptional regulator